MTADNIRFPLLQVIFCNITLFVQPETMCFSQRLDRAHRKRAPEKVLTRISTANFGRCF